MERMPDPMRWLGTGVPLTLLMDLLEKDGPGSDAILSNEPADLEWTKGVRAA